MEGAACVGDVRSSWKKEVICGACCTAALEAVVGEAGALAEAVCSASMFMFLEVSTRGVPPAHGGWCVLCAHGTDVYHPAAPVIYTGDIGRGP